LLRKPRLLVLGPVVISPPPSIRAIVLALVRKLLCSRLLRLLGRLVFAVIPCTPALVVDIRGGTICRQLLALGP